MFSLVPAVLSSKPVLRPYSCHRLARLTAGWLVSVAVPFPFALRPRSPFRPFVRRRHTAFRVGVAKPVAALGKQKSRFHDIGFWIFKA